mmetsp:Transcript_1452/g.3348  ORF Transcript_1452/g.3348 Transcript_1452/m.3348 type:complete len:206 (+) Transcript_1452:186-803(+)
MNFLINRIASVPNSVASIPLINFPCKRVGGRCFFKMPSERSSPCLLSSTKLIMSCNASMSFIFMKGHVAQPPAVEHPSPPATPGTIGSSFSLLVMEFVSQSSTVMTASELTGKMISASTLRPFKFDDALPRICCTFSTIDVTIPASVPRMNRSFLSFASSDVDEFAASSTLRLINFKISAVDPTTPSSFNDFCMPMSNISPGTSK